MSELASLGAYGDSLRDRLVDDALALPLGNLAALNRVATLCADPNATAAGVALEATRDEAFSALLLRLANSAYSMSTTPVSELSRAVARLGLRLVQGLALAAPGVRLLKGPPDGLGPARRELHRHAVRVGVAAWATAPAGVDPEEAMSAGLLHNLGLNVLSIAAPGAFRMVVDAGAKGQSVSAVEEAHLGFTHAELGALVAERWSYPLSLVIAIRDHDAQEPATDLARLVRVCDLLVRESGAGIEPPSPPGGTAPELDAARDRLRPLLEAHDRLESAGGGEEAPRVSAAILADALDVLV